MNEQSPTVEGLAARLHYCTNLPSPPGIAVRLIEVCQNPQVEIDEVLDLVAKDPTMTAKLLRMANSPFYGGARKTANLRQICMLFGINGVLNLALSFAISNGLRKVPVAGIDQNRYWYRSLAVAVAARLLGRQFCPSRSGDLYLVGLLQDLGMLALGKLDPAFYLDMQAQALSHAELCRLEADFFGADHAAAGAWLLQSWRLPDWLCATVAGSHDPGAAGGNDEATLMMRCVAAASELADLPRTRELFVHAERINRYLPLEVAEIAELVQKVAAETDDTAPLFQVSIDDELAAEHLVESANELLEVRALQREKSLRALRERATMLESETDRLRESSCRDGLTRLYNRDHLDAVLPIEFTSAQRHGWPLSVLFLDLDDFKAVNDRYGHQAGDGVLQTAAAVIDATTRDEDIVARYGGEEFLLLLPGTGRPGAETLAQRILDAMRQAKFVTEDGDRLHITTSIGIATYGEPETFDSAKALVAAADKALYMAKHAGKNRFAVYSAAA